MAEIRSAWRTSDSVAYETVRASLDALIEQTLRDSNGTSSIARVAELRRRVLETDGFDRDAVDRLRAELEGLVRTTASARG